MLKKSKSIKNPNRVPWSEVPALIKDTVIEFFQVDGLFHGAALAYYTVFALVPLFYLSLSFFGRIIGQDVMLEIISNLLQNKVGIQDVSGIMEFMAGVDFDKGNIIVEILGIFVLVVVASAFVVSLKHSINEFFNIKVKYDNNKQAIIKNIVFRLLSVGFVGVVTILIITLYFAQTVVLGLSDTILDDYDKLSWFFNSIIQHGLAIFSNVVIFTLVFKYLHDGFVTWKLAIGGALVTSVLLYIGQLLIKYYLFNYFYLSGGGIAGSLFIILTWVYYSSQIIFFGAKFTYVYARRIGKPIEVAGVKTVKDAMIKV